MQLAQRPREESIPMNCYKSALADGKESALLNFICGSFCHYQSHWRKEGFFFWSNSLELLNRHHNDWLCNSFFITLLQSHNCACRAELWMRFTSIRRGRGKLTDGNSGSASVLSALKSDSVTPAQSPNNPCSGVKWKCLHKGVEKGVWGLIFFNNTCVAGDFY